MTQKFTYFFSKELCQGNANMKDVLGGKGANLAEMASLGLSVPPGFTISTSACNDFYSNNSKINASVISEVKEHISRLEELNAKGFGDRSNPLLFSIRSGARASMPGMMDTILNVGLNDQTVEGLAIKTNNRWFALDSYRRLLQMYADVVVGLPKSEFDNSMDELKEELAIYDEREFSEESLEQLIARYKDIYKQHGHEFPQDVYSQLWSSIEAVFKSWMNHRAITYRKINDIPQDWGTAVNVQTMVFGNFGQTSGTGVLFTRNPSTGENRIFGEYMMNAQGEDVVAGTRTPSQINKFAREEIFSEQISLEELMPDVYVQLAEKAKFLESHFQDVQDIEFTIENGKLWFLQTRSAKRSANAAVKIAYVLAKDGVISKEDAVMKISPQQVEQLLHPTIANDSGSRYNVLSTALPASPGAATGIACFCPAEAAEISKNCKVILIRKETSPEDINGMHSSVGILTATGGMTSHAAVVARGMGKPCVVGASCIAIDEVAKYCKIGNVTIKAGDFITINGSTGEIIEGKVETAPPSISPEFSEILSWADQIRTIGVRANADTPQDSKIANEFGAEGIGLCRTEHMFFQPSRITQVRKMILSTDEDAQKEALDKLFEYQKLDFSEIFKVMQSKPVTIRLLDPPLHEFLPNKKDEIEQLSSEIGMSVADIKERLDDLKECNPMLGHRGCRLGITNPEIYKMQVRAIFEAALEFENPPVLEIMIPLIFNNNELTFLKSELVLEIEAAFVKYAKNLKYLFGTMIELPRAALVADQLAEHTEFFSFGTNDLTQTTLGLSRDDAGKFMPSYIEKKIVANDPFVTIDQEGVGKLIEMSCAKGLAVKPNLKLGVCGEHGGDPKSVHFFHKLGLDYVSCSPFRVPVARLAAAQASIVNNSKA